MAICDRRHANMSKQTTTLADIDVTPSLGLAYGHMVCHQCDQSVIGRAKHFREFKAFRHEISLRFYGDSDYVEMFLLVLEVPSFLFAYLP